MCDEVSLERVSRNRGFRIQFKSHHSRENISAFRTSETALLEGLQQCNPDAQAALFDSCESSVKKTLTRILREPQDVADALQDTFVRSFRNALQVKDPQALRGWVLRVAESVALDQLRRRRRLRGRNEESADASDVPVDDASMELRAAVRSTYQVLDRLPEEERLVFSLRYVDGMELGKLASYAGVSLATIKRRLARAEARFRILAGREPGLADWLRLTQS
jgi:RNA polymerase sigma-70 factor (ECF subfamily)